MAEDKESFEMLPYMDLVNLDTDRLDRFINTLGIQEEEFFVLSVIYDLNSRKIKANVAKIKDSFFSTYGVKNDEKTVIKYLNSLLSFELVKKSGDEYNIDFEQLKGRLKTKEEELKRDIVNIELIKPKLHDYLSRSTKDLVKSQVNYISSDEMYELLAIHYERARECYCVASFPRIGVLGQKEIMSTLSSSTAKYLKVMEDRCRKGELKVNYITMLNIEEPFYSTKTHYGDVDKAYQYTSESLNNFQKQVESMENLHVYYEKRPFGFHGVMPIIEQPTHLFLVVRDVEREARKVHGAIHIRSPLIASKVHALYKEVANRSLKITHHNSEQVFKDLKSHLDRIYRNEKSRAD